MSPRAQRNAATVLGTEAVALGVGGALALVLGATSDEAPPVAVAPSISPTSAGVTAGGRF